jgi:hypothetical protein
MMKKREGDGVQFGCPLLSSSSTTSFYCLSLILTQTGWRSISRVHLECLALHLVEYKPTEGGVIVFVPIQPS